MVITRRQRLILAVSAATLAVLALAAFIAVRLLLQPQRFTDMLRSQMQAAGLQLSLSAPAEPTLWPRPALVLRGMTISIKGQPLLIAARGRLAIPWHALLGGPATITRLELDAPRLDLGALRTALVQLPSAPAGSTPTLPRIETGIVINDGSLVLNDALLLDHLDLHAGTLAPGQAFAMQAAAAGSSGQPYSFLLNMTPHNSHHAVEFDNLRVSVHSGHAAGAVLHGQARWRGGSDISMELAGNLQRSADRTYRMGLRMVPPSADKPLRLDLKLDGPGMNADLHVPPVALAGWWGRITDGGTPGNLPLPPLDGYLQADSLDLGGVHFQGLELRAGSALPAGSATAATPPSTLPATVKGTSKVP